MNITKEYGKKYVKLKQRINFLKLRPLYPTSTIDENIKHIEEYINSLAKELDMLYSDERYFDGLEEKINTLEKTLK